MLRFSSLCLYYVCVCCMNMNCMYRSLLLFVCCFFSLLLYIWLVIFVFGMHKSIHSVSETEFGARAILYTNRNEETKGKKPRNGKKKTICMYRSTKIARRNRQEKQSGFKYTDWEATANTQDQEEKSVEKSKEREENGKQQQQINIIIIFLVNTTRGGRKNCFNRIEASQCTILCGIHTANSPHRLHSAMNAMKKRSSAAVEKWIRPKGPPVYKRHNTYRYKFLVCDFLSFLYIPVYISLVVHAVRHSTKHTNFIIELMCTCAYIHTAMHGIDIDTTSASDVMSILFSLVATESTQNT